MEILIISKYEGESEYVIYRNDFDAPASLDGLIFESGKDLCRWENGALVMDSTGFRPEYRINTAPGNALGVRKLQSRSRFFQSKGSPPQILLFLFFSVPEI